MFSFHLNSLLNYYIVGLSCIILFKKDLFIHGQSTIRHISWTKAETAEEIKQAILKQSDVVEIDVVLKYNNPIGKTTGILLQEWLQEIKKYSITAVVHLMEFQALKPAVDILKLEKFDQTPNLWLSANIVETTEEIEENTLKVEIFSDYAKKYCPKCTLIFGVVPIRTNNSLEEYYWKAVFCALRGIKTINVIQPIKFKVSDAIVFNIINQILFLKDILSCDFIVSLRETNTLTISAIKYLWQKLGNYILFLNFPDINSQLLTINSSEESKSVPLTSVWKFDHKNGNSLPYVGTETIIMTSESKVISLNKYASVAGINVSGKITYFNDRKSNKTELMNVLTMRLHNDKYDDIIVECISQNNVSICKNSRHYSDIMFKFNLNDFATQCFYFEISSGNTSDVIDPIIYSETCTKSILLSEDKSVHNGFTSQNDGYYVEIIGNSHNGYLILEQINIKGEPILQNEFPIKTVLISSKAIQRQRTLLLFCNQLILYFWCIYFSFCFK